LRNIFAEKNLINNSLKIKIMKERKMSHSLPALPYAYDALEPYIDQRTMEIHHQKHHAGYVAKLNTALEAYPDLQSKGLEDLLKNLKNVPENIRTAVRNNGGGHYNHTIFWNIMGADSSGEPDGDLATAITKKFGSFSSFKDEFSAAAANRFGSGWAWLVLDKSSNLAVMSTANQDNPVSEGFKPVLGLDVWEHAYYLKYQNKRPEYIENWWKVVNWRVVSERYKTMR
jgi:Fe-Mn family superoxide dismutase